MFETDMGAGKVSFCYETPHWCRVIGSKDPIMPVGTAFPAKDLNALNCEITYINVDDPMESLLESL